MSDGFEHAIDRRWARFKNRDTEARYEAGFEAEDRRTFVLAGLLGAAGVGLKAIAHASIHPDTTGLGWLVHGGTIAALLCFSFVGWRGVPR